LLITNSRVTLLFCACRACFPKARARTVVYLIVRFHKGALNHDRLGFTSVREQELTDSQQAWGNNELTERVGAGAGASDGAWNTVNVDL